MEVRFPDFSFQKLTFKNSLRKKGIYAIVNLLDNKKYVGSSIDLYTRLQSHRNHLDRGVHDNEYLQRAWRKNGSENFEFQIILLFYEIPTDLLRFKEGCLIRALSATSVTWGYTLNVANAESFVVSDSTRKKLSDNCSKPVISYDLLTGEVKHHKKFGNSITRYNTLKRGSVFDNKFWFKENGLDLTSLKERFLNKPKERTTILLDTETGIFYDSVKELARNLGMNYSTIKLKIRTNSLPRYQITHGL